MTEDIKENVFRGTKGSFVILECVQCERETTKFDIDIVSHCPYCGYSGFNVIGGGRKN